MASFTASRAASSLGGSEMWGNPLNFNGTARSAPPNVSTPSALKTVAIFSKKPIPRPPQFLPPTMSSPSDCKRFQDCFSTMDSAIKDSPMRSLILPWRCLNVHLCGCKDGCIKSCGLEDFFKLVHNVVQHKSTWSMSRNRRLEAAALVLMILQCSSWLAYVTAQAQVPAMFVFGDSLVDVGNNNFLRSMARANYAPYGYDFSSGPTGRFSNGKNLVDMFADLLGLPYPPPFADPETVGSKILNGVNYASAAAGILDETGQHYGQRFSLSQQVVNFEMTLNQLRSLMSAGNLTQYLAKSIAVLVIGSNDYINNYLLPSLYTSSLTYSPPQFANLLLNHYARQLLALHSVGLRKFMVAGVGPLGCIPNQRATGLAPEGRCLDSVNQILGTLNEGLRSLVDQLNTNRPGAMFVYANTYGAVGDILNNPATYGFSVVDMGCCGLGRNQEEITCLPCQVPCADRNQFVFWDAFHPTQAATAVLALRAFRGPPSDSYPMNIQQMALL